MKTNTLNKKRILIFSIAYYPFVGGAEIAVKEITKRLKNYDFTLITLRMDKSLPQYEIVGNMEIWRIGFPGSPKLTLAVNWPLFISKYLFPFWALFKALRLHKKKKFCLSWAIMANYAGFAASFFKRFNPQIPFLLTLQEGDPPAHIRKKVGPFMSLYKKIFRRADKVQAISRFLGDYAKQMGHKKEISVIPNGVDIEIFSKDFSEEQIKSAEKILEKKEGDIFLFTSSRLVRKNAVDDIIRSLSFLPQNFKLFIAGQGEEEDDLKKLADDLKVSSRVVFGGFIEHKNLAALLKASDIFVRPSRSEGMGNSFIEAMAAGIPVIAAPVGGIVDFIIDGQTGIFCKVDDPKDLAEKVKILATNAELKQKIVENGQKLVVEKYSWDFIAEKMNKIFEKLCKF